MVVRTGGPATLTTLIHRGLASRHTGLIWEGFNIQNIVNGTYDVSLLGSFTFDQLTFEDVGVSATLGNATMGGVLNLENKWKGPKFHAALSYGADQNWDAHLGWRTTLKKYRQAIKVEVSDQKTVSYTHLTLPTTSRV